ncbi:MAG TPA: NADH-quinone oxidoreductase subunit C, partial [Solirubrobacteraceae bacterium]|nr:NADH-quinone oxidoreductase subunit C [Solirubrobacteraceae bacterium]
MPDQAGLEALGQLLGDAVLGTTHDNDRAEIQIDPARNVEVLEALRGQGYSFLASLHGLDYYPHEPRLGVIYELLDMKQVDRVTVKARVSIDAAQIASVVHMWPGADWPEREVYDMFGVEFSGHPDLRRILMPEDYEGHPQRRDFPVGGEPVLFTHNET